MQISHSVISSPHAFDELSNVLETHKPALFFSESPTNPFLRCIDIRKVSKLCHSHGTLVCIDSTFATPVNQQSLQLGADLVIHSLTKYIAGHNDVLGGAVVGHKDLLQKIKSLHNILGGVADPFASYLILRGMKTLALRIKHQNETGMLLAQRLENHPCISRVHYPGLASHPDHSIATAQMNGFGGVLSFEVKGSLETTMKFIDALQIPYIAPSLGGVESLVEQPAVISYWDQRPEERARLGISDNLVRYSCGVESAQDLWIDIERALNQCQK